MNKIKDNSFTRQMNLEMLRIVTMFMIIMLHFLAHGGVLNALPSDGLKFYFYWSVAGICYVAVNCYVLITGYFQSISKFRLKKLLLLLMEVFFYSIIIYMGLCLFDIRQFTVKDFLLALFPTLNSEYWFVTIYIGLYILSPFINWALNQLEHRQHLLLLIMLIALFSAWPNLFFLSVGLNFGGSFGIVWFFVLYCIGAYIRKYSKKESNVWKWVGSYLILSGLIPFSKFILSKISVKYLNSFVPDSLFYSYNSILVLGASIALFNIFIRIQIKNTFFLHMIRFFSGSVFGIYLIHDNPFIREYMWNTLAISQYLNFKGFPFIMLGTVLLIFMIGTFIDKLRIILFNWFIKIDWLDRICEIIEIKAYKTYHCQYKERKHEENEK